MRTSTSRVAPAAALAFALLIAASPVLAADPDPMALLAGAAQAIADAPSASVDLRVQTKLVRDDKVNDQSAYFVFRTAPEGRFEFKNVAEDGGPSKMGYHVVGNDDVTITAILSGKRHMLAPSEEGFAAFVRAPSAESIGGGLGGLALAFLNPAAIADVATGITESEFIGVEEVDGEKLLHSRYTVNGEFPVDVWYQAEGAPLVRRVLPNILNTPGVKQMASRYEKFEFLLAFEFTNWNTDAGLTKKDIVVVEPKDSQLMASLYAPPKEPPHALLGKPAPPFELPTPEGKTVSFDKPSGEGATLLEFWATTCPICVQAMPALEKLHEKYADQGLKYYAVNVGETADDVASFLKQRNLTPQALLDESSEVANAYEVGPIPLILLVNADGRVQVAQVGFGPKTGAKLDQQIEATLRGEDVAAAQLEEVRKAEAERVAEQERLRSLLDS
jgi:thiol-disulfide isomerase/thioredoxin